MPSKTSKPQPQLQPQEPRPIPVPCEQDDLFIVYDEDRQTIVIEVPYDPKADYPLTSKGTSHAVASNLKFGADLDTGTKVESFFITLGVYRTQGNPRNRRRD